MSKRYSDEEIRILIEEPRPLPESYRNRLVLVQKRGHKESQIEVTGTNGGLFVLMMRKSDFNEFDFSVILGVNAKDSNQIFRLKRYNGKSHEHTNRIERNTFYDYHIHCN